MASVEIPHPLRDVWYLDNEALRTTLETGDLGGMDMSSLLKWYLGLFMDDEDEQQSHEVPSLKFMALDGIVESLNLSEDLTSDVELVLKGLDRSLFHDLLLRPSMQYSVLRLCLEAADTVASPGKALIDIDDAVLANEQYLRDQTDQNDAYLLTLENFWDSLPVYQSEPSMGVIMRTELAKDDIRLFEENHDPQIRLHSSSADTAEILFQGVLKQLERIDWTNVIVAGDFLIQVLMEEPETLEAFSDPSPIDLFLIGLNVAQANEKIDQIHHLWATNYAIQNGDSQVIKNATHISFLVGTGSPHRPVRVRLKLYKTATEALLDTNSSTVAFNGTEVLMLPRCARVLETGFITMTTDHLSGRQTADHADFVDRLPSYRDLRFGLRILPSYVRTLQGTSGRPFLARNLERPKPDNPVFARVNNPGWQLSASHEDAYVEAIDRYNDEQFTFLQNAICSKLRIPVQRSGYSNYLTRRIRLQIYGNDLASVQEKQMTIPLAIAAEVENQIEWSIFSEIDRGHKWLIPIHDPSKHDSQTARLPSLPTSTNGTNLRYWIISNGSMWAGQHPVLDELAELLWYLHEWFRAGSGQFDNTYENTPALRLQAWLCRLIKYMRQRLGPYPHTSSAEDHIRRKQGLPPLKEALQFRAFVLQEPPYQIDNQSSVGDE